MDLTMHHTLPERVISMAINNLFNIIRLKLLVQGLKLVELFRQLADKYNFHKQVSNMQI